MALSTLEDTITEDIVDLEGECWEDKLNVPIETQKLVRAVLETKIGPKPKFPETKQDTVHPKPDQGLVHHGTSCGLVAEKCMSPYMKLDD